MNANKSNTLCSIKQQRSETVPVPFGPTALPVQERYDASPVRPADVMDIRKIKPTSFIKQYDVVAAAVTHNEVAEQSWKLR